MKILALIILAFSLMASAFASPGAHGPNGEHLDGPGNTATAGSAPRVETFSEMFELVGQLSGGKFSVMVDRYETNEPILNSTLEVQYKELKATAKFQPDMGDYAINDPAFLKALSAPGKHALMFTIIAGQDSDLLEGTLEVTAPAAEERHHTAYWKWIALAVAATALIALAIFIGRRRRKAIS